MNEKLKLPPESRRSFLKKTSALAALAAAPPLLTTAAASHLDEKAARFFEQTPLQLEINGKMYELSVEPRVTLLDLLREQLHLTGTKKGCDHGQCGACTVHIDGKRNLSCLSLAVMHHGKKITTIEGISKGEDLHPVQAAFIEQDGFQCGYCTPGQICSAVALLAEVERGDASFVTADLRPRAPVELSDDEIRERMSGNICRCGAYPGIVAAVKMASRAVPPATGR